MVGVVDGDPLMRAHGEACSVSFLLADEREALVGSGESVVTLLGWCQVICSQPDVATKAQRLVSGDRVRVSGQVEIVKSSPLELSSDAVLVSVIAAELALEKRSLRRQVIGD